MTKTPLGSKTGFMIHEVDQVNLADLVQYRVRHIQHRSPKDSIAQPTTILPLAQTSFARTLCRALLTSIPARFKQHEADETRSSNRQVSETGNPQGSIVQTSFAIFLPMSEAASCRRMRNSPQERSLVRPTHSSASYPPQHLVGPT